jgi:thiamine monophosphate synthase
LAKEAAAIADIPIVTIGGITGQNVAQMTEAVPFVRVAVSQSVIAARDITAAARTIKQQLV